MYLRNAWYVAAWDREVTREPMARTLLGEPVVFFRTGDGRPVALEDRCRHRRAPLSAGKVVGDTLQCGYHGLRFDAAGVCVGVPSQRLVPPGTRVRSYPAVERRRWVWVWMGDPDRADESEIPDLYWHDSPEWAAIGDRFHVRCHYQALIDIQLDQTHSKYVHPTSLANDGALSTPPRVTREARAVHGARYMPRSDPQPLFAKARRFEGETDVWIAWTYRPPATITFDAGCADAGTGAFEGKRDRAVTIFNSHGITPETERTTHHFWVSARDFAIEDEEVSQTLAQFRDTFLEDVAMVEAQQRAIDTDPSAPTIDLGADNPTIQARNLLARLIADETAAAGGQ